MILAAWSSSVHDAWSKISSVRVTSVLSSRGTHARAAGSRGRTKMGKAIITFKIMPTSPDVDLDAIKAEALAAIKDFAGETSTKEEIEPVAFGLKALKITFVMDESIGEMDSLEEKLRSIEGVNSAEVSDVRRALG